MKQKNKKINLIFKVIIVAILIFTNIQINSKTYADVGSFEDYSSGSDWSSSSDWGSSSDWSSSSSDWGSSSSSWSSSWDDDYSYGSSGGGLSINLFSGFSSIILLIIFILIIYLNHKNNENRKKYSNRNFQYYSNNQRTNKPKVTYNNEGVVAKLKQVDPNFNRVKFESFVKEVFIKLQNAWTERDWEKIRPFESETLFEQHKAQLDGYIKNNQINVMERISVNDINFISFEQTEENDVIMLDLDSRMGDYIIDATTKALIKGDKNREYYHTYTLTFIRKKGNQTKKDTDGTNTTNCPNCGAPTVITSSGRCEYCNSVITTDDYDWVLTNLTRRY